MNRKNTSPTKILYVLDAENLPVYLHKIVRTEKFRQPFLTAELTPELVEAMVVSESKYAEAIQAFNAYLKRFADKQHLQRDIVEEQADDYIEAFERAADKLAEVEDEDLLEGVCIV